MKRFLRLSLAVILVLTIGIVSVGCGSKNKQDKDSASDVEVELPWEEGGKKPAEYTWDEFNALTGPQQIKFQESFKEFEEFEDWMEDAQAENGKLPWVKEGRSPSDYTWDEFLALDGPLQIQFQNAFEDDKAFEKWMLEAQEDVTDIPWENGGKKPEEYTWEEFNKLTGPQQIKFQESFEKFEDFEKWMDKARTPKQ